MRTPRPTVPSNLSTMFSTVRAPRSARAIIHVAILVLLACSGEDPTTPVQRGEPARLVLTGPGSLTEGEFGVLRADVLDAAGHVLIADVEWTSSDPSVVLVDRRGIISAIVAGSATITARAGTLSATQAITVHLAPVGSITIAPGYSRLYAGDTVKLTAAVFGLSGAPLHGRPIVWSTSDTAIVHLATDGKVTARRAGSANIVARSGTMSQTATIAVFRTPFRVSIGDTLRMHRGQWVVDVLVSDSVGARIVNAPIVWSVADTALARFTRDDMIDARGVGETMVRARAHTATDDALVRILPDDYVNELWIGIDSLTVYAGDSSNVSSNYIYAFPMNLVRNIVYSKVDSIRYTSADPAIAEVTARGRVFGKTVGRTTIAARVDDVSRTLPVGVERMPVLAVGITPSDTALALGLTRQLTATVYSVFSRTLTDRPVVWASSDPSKVRVSQTGLIEGVVAGVSTITASCEGKTATLRVRVY